MTSQPTVSFLVSLSFPPDVTPDTTADGAAGIFGLYLMGATPVADQVHFEMDGWWLTTITREGLHLVDQSVNAFIHSHVR